MKPFKQGAFSRYCSVYSTLNALKRLGIKLSFNDWQELYDYIISQLNVYDGYFDTGINGALPKRLEGVFVFAREWLNKNQKIKLEYKRQYWGKRPSKDDFICDVKQSLANKHAIIICINSPNFSHYTNISRVTKEKLYCFDSCNIKDIKLKSLSIEKGRHYQIKWRCVYFLSVQTEYTPNSQKKNCANKIKNTSKCTAVKPSHKCQLHAKEQAQ